MAATRALARAMAETGLSVAGLGAVEMAEGVTRLAISIAAHERGQELARSGEAKIVEGMAGDGSGRGYRPRG